MSTLKPCVGCGEVRDLTKGYCYDCLEWEVCEACGSDKLQVRMWVVLNGPNALKVLESCEDETAWCEACEMSRPTVLRSTYFDRAS